MAGVTFSAPGNWTSWPPHEHAQMLRRRISTSTCRRRPGACSSSTPTRSQPELAAVVREGDCVLMPQGYHPNVAAPGGSHQLPVDDGGRARGRGPAVRRRQRAAGLRGRRLRPRRGRRARMSRTRRTCSRDWSTIPVEDLGGGVWRQMVVGERLHLCRLRFAPHVVTTPHDHPHEQMTIVEQGPRPSSSIGDEEREVGAGDGVALPLRRLARCDHARRGGGLAGHLYAGS